MCALSLSSVVIVKTCLLGWGCQQGRGYVCTAHMQLNKLFCHLLHLHLFNVWPFYQYLPLPPLRLPSFLVLTFFFPLAFWSEFWDLIYSVLLQIFLEHTHTTRKYSEGRRKTKLYHSPRIGRMWRHQSAEERCGQETCRLWTFKNPFSIFEPELGYFSTSVCTSNSFWDILDF